jgi:hypothetical protein
MWFCVPHQADDDCLDKCAALIKGKLNPSRTLYIEYSNECWSWGGGFCQFGWINASNGVGGWPESSRRWRLRGQATGSCEGTGAVE